jgi:phosphoribosylamine--glycine ligase
MRRLDIPTGTFQIFTDTDEATEFIRDMGAPIVVKADGLAAGKGVIVCQTKEEALKAAQAMLQGGKFGGAGAQVVVEEKLQGPEASIFALCDGRSYKILPTSQDHKRVFDKDEGPNTGGMGAYAPAPVVTPGILKQVEREIIIPVLQGMEKEGCPYSGVLYVGIMITASGPKVIEYNCRFGDPETQPLLPLIGSDLASHLLACSEGKLQGENIEINPVSAICVVLASGGYPGIYPKDILINGWQNFESETGALLFHASTKMDNQGNLFTAGGRVLGVTATAPSFLEAHKLVYQAVEHISFKGMHFRRDIGVQALK